MNAIPYTLKVQSLADVSVPDNIKTVLRNDMAKVLDSAAATEFKTCVYKAAVVNTATTTFSTSGTASATALGNMSDKNVRDVIDKLKTLNVPRYDGKVCYCRLGVLLNRVKKLCFLAWQEVQRTIPLATSYINVGSMATGII